MKRAIISTAAVLVAGMATAAAQIPPYGHAGMRPSMLQNMRVPQGLYGTEVLQKSADAMAEQLRTVLGLDDKQTRKVQGAFYSQLRSETAQGIDIARMPDGDAVRRALERTDGKARDDEPAPQQPQTAIVYGDAVAEEEEAPVPADPVEVMENRREKLEKKFRKILTPEQLEKWRQLENEKLKAYFTKM